MEMGPTREELIAQLASAETKVIELEEASDRLFRANVDIVEENSQLKSDLYYSKRENLFILFFSLASVLSLFIKNYVH